jgi:hypothetical protein
MAVACPGRVLRAALEFLGGTSVNEIVLRGEDDVIAGRSRRYGHR